MKTGSLFRFSLKRWLGLWCRKLFQGGKKRVHGERTMGYNTGERRQLAGVGCVITITQRLGKMMIHLVFYIYSEISHALSLIIFKVLSNTRNLKVNDL